MAFFEHSLGKPAPEGYETFQDFNEVRDDGVAVASTGSYANHLHFSPFK